MNISQIISFSPRKVANILSEMKAGTYEAIIDRVEVNKKKSKAELFVDFVVDPETFHRERKIRKNHANPEYEKGLHDAMNPTSFEVAEPIPCVSNVCKCEDINDFSLEIINTKTITQAFIDEISLRSLIGLAGVRRDNFITNTIIVAIADEEIAINISYPANIVFEEVKCGTCGTDIGWCVEIGGRVFKTTPSEFINGLIGEQIVKYVEGK